MKVSRNLNQLGRSLPLYLLFGLDSNHALTLKTMNCAVFKLDVFTISYVSAAIRGFTHHFFPAYGQPIVDYSKIMNAEKER